jgi:hypothetical protein
VGRAARCALGFIAGIGAIVIAPLSEFRAEAMAAIRAAEGHSIAPFDKVLSVENIFIIRPTPDEDQWRIADWTPTPINDSTRARHFYDPTLLNGLGSNKKFRWGISVTIIEHKIASRPAPINLNSHVFGWRVAAIFPFWRNGKTSDVEVGVRSIFLRQIFDFDLCGIFCRTQFGIEAVNENECTFRCLQSFSGGPQYHYVRRSILDRQHFHYFGWRHTT